MKEEFKVITTQYVRKNAYLISNKGRIYSKLSNKFLKCYLDNDGYYNISLLTNEDYPRRIKRYRLNRLVAYEFISNPENLPIVNHIDGNKINNNIKNLEWCTAQENTIHADITGLRHIRGENNGNCIYSDELCDKICQLLEDGYVVYSIFASLYPGERTCDRFSEYMEMRRLRERKIRPDITSKYSYTLESTTIRNPSNDDIILFIKKGCNEEYIMNYYGYISVNHNKMLYRRIKYLKKRICE